MQRLPILVLALAGTLVLVPMAGSAQLQSEGVIYAFMSMRVGTAQQAVLVPIPSDQVRPDLPLQATIPAAFGVLRRGKPATYGNASVTATDALLAESRVAVNLDPGADASAFEIIAAETVMTFSALGIERVTFPGWSEGGLTRADIQYATYQLQVPMWQALVGGRVPGAEVVLTDGRTLPSIDFAQRMERGDTELQRMALGILAAGDRQQTFAVLSVVERLGIDGYESAVVPLTVSSDPYLREAALRPLVSSQDPAAWSAVVAMMSDDAEPRIRGLAAQALAASPLESFRVFEVFHRANATDRPTRLAALNEAGRIADERIPGQLAPFLADDDADVRRAAVDALHAQRAWGELEAAVANEGSQPDVRIWAAAALAADASGDAQLTGLQYRGLATTGEPALAAVDRIATMSGDPARVALEAFLNHSDATVGTHAATVIGERGLEVSLAALSAANADPALAVDVQLAADDAAASIMAGLPRARVESHAAARDPFTRRAAYRALGAFAAQGGGSLMNTLRAGLQDADAGIRGASARSLGIVGGDDALNAVLTLEGDPDASVQADVALALQGFPGEEFADRVMPAVVGFVQGGEPLVIAAALSTLAALEQRQLISVVLEKVQYPDARVRAEAMRAAVALARPDDARAVINAVNTGLRDQDVQNRVLAARLLGRFDDPLAVISLSQVVNVPVAEIRFAAIAAIGETGQADGVGTLVALLEDPDRDIRLAAVAALRVLNRRAALPGVQAQLGREQDPVSADALRSLVEHLSAGGT